MRCGHGAAAGRRSSFPHPKPILLVCRIGDNKSPSLLFPAHPPFMGFGMSIRKGKAAAQIMIRSGNVIPYWTFHPETKSGIVDVRYVFVQQHPQHGRAWGTDAGKLAIGGPRGIPLMSILIVQPGAIHRLVGNPAMSGSGPGTGFLKARANRANGVVHRKSPRRRNNLSDQCRIRTCISSHACVTRTMKQGGIARKIVD